VKQTQHDLTAKGEGPPAQQPWAVSSWFCNFIWWPRDPIVPLNRPFHVSGRGPGRKPLTMTEMK